MSSVAKDISLLNKLTRTNEENDYLLSRLKKMTLLAKGATSTKLAKGTDDIKSAYDNYIMYLSPHDKSGINLCPWASEGCIKGCLDTSGHGAFSSVQLARLRKSLFYRKFRHEFYEKLDREIKAGIRRAEKVGKTACFRLNGTSDIPWESVKLLSGLPLIAGNPSAVFYDYTKGIQRAIDSVRGTIDSRFTGNYTLTFSRSEANESDCIQALNAGVNVAVVLDDIADIEKGTLVGFEMINGDKHDYRFLDKKGGLWVALSAKGKAKKDTSGFVVTRDSLLKSMFYKVKKAAGL